jgi:prevent-host-death family protein
MRRIGAFEAKNTLGTLLDLAESGEEVMITRRGKDVARLVPAATGVNRVKAENAARGLVELSRGLSLRGLSIKELINEGRQ